VAQHRLSAEHTPVTLTQRRSSTQVQFVSEPWQVAGADHLLNKIWGSTRTSTPALVGHPCQPPAQKLFDGTKGWRLFVYGYGYRFDRTDAAGERVA
jgi:DNA-binding response OmpR family regulator